MRELVRQGAYFTIISGIGWCMDFTLFSIFSICLAIPVQFANIASAVPAVTFVFFMATRHIFTVKKGGLSLWQKYIVYVAYQVVLVTAVSYLTAAVYHGILAYVSMEFVQEMGKIIAKCIVTPVTMCTNFLFMKVLMGKF